MAVFADEELPLHPFLLSMASPVFEAMFASSMTEGKSNRFEVTIVTKEQFEVFYAWLHPVDGRDLELREDNVNYMLKIANYYQIQKLKEMCATCLHHMFASVERLLLADECGLSDLRDNIADRIAEDPGDHDLESLKAYPELLLVVISKICPKFSAQKRKINEQTKELQFYKVKRQKLEVKVEH